jgi:hypothetical protein
MRTTLEMADHRQLQLAQLFFFPAHTAVHSFRELEQATEQEIPSAYRQM